MCLRHHAACEQAMGGFWLNERVSSSVEKRMIRCLSRCRGMTFVESDEGVLLGRLIREKQKGTSPNGTACQGWGLGARLTVAHGGWSLTDTLLCEDELNCQHHSLFFFTLMAQMIVDWIPWAREETAIYKSYEINPSSPNSFIFLLRIIKAQAPSSHWEYNLVIPELCLSSHNTAHFWCWIHLGPSAPPLPSLHRQWSFAGDVFCWVLLLAVYFHQLPAFLNDNKISETSLW